MKPIFSILTAAVLATTLTACDDDDDTTASTEPGNIVEVASANGSFTTLVAALESTRLDLVLADDTNTFTVFAPTDEAFAKIDTTNLTNDELENILLYHVIPGAEIDSMQATDAAGGTVQMANGDDMALSLSGSDLFANLSKVIIPDVDASNGIIHAIDTVLLPPAEAGTPTQTIAEIAVGDPNFSTLVTALSATSDLVSTLSDPDGDYTVFAPTNDAFTALEASNPGITAALLADPDGTLRDILLKHVVDGSADSITAFTLNGTDVATVNGETVEIAIDSGKLTIDAAQVTTFDIQATNGIIHVIDAVILLD